MELSVRLLDDQMVLSLFYAYHSSRKDTHLSWFGGKKKNQRTDLCFIAAIIIRNKLNNVSRVERCSQRDAMIIIIWGESFQMSPIR